MNIGTLGRLPAEIRLMIWFYMAQAGRDAMLEHYKLQTKNIEGRSPQHALAIIPSPWVRKLNHLALSFLRTCRSIHEEAIEELYDFSELHFRVDSQRSRWELKDMRKFSESYGTFIIFDNTEHKYFIRSHKRATDFFWRLHGHGERLKFNRIRIDMLAPRVETNVRNTDVIVLRNHAKSLDDLGLASFISCARRLDKLTIVLKDTEERKWRVYPLGLSFQYPHYTNVEAVLLPFCYLRNIEEVDITFPELLKDNSRLVEVAEHLKSDLTFPGCVRDPRLSFCQMLEQHFSPSMFQGSIILLDKSLCHDDCIVAEHFDRTLDYALDQHASKLRREVFDNFYTYIKETEMRMEILGKGKNNLPVAYEARYQAATTWYWARYFQEKEYCKSSEGVPPLIRDSFQWRLLQFDAGKQHGSHKNGGKFPYDVFAKASRLNTQDFLPKHPEGPLHSTGLGQIG